MGLKLTFGWFFPNQINLTMPLTLAHPFWDALAQISIIWVLLVIFHPLLCYFPVLSTHKDIEKNDFVDERHSQRLTCSAQFFIGITLYYRFFGKVL